jgi:two-component system, chemotaxis family, sensor kinase CheA
VREHPEIPCMDFTEIINDFLDDGDMHLNAFDRALLTLEKSGPNKEIVLSALGSLHTLKGNSGMMGFESLKIYIHKAEEALKRIDENHPEPDKILTLLFDASNIIRNALQGIAKNSGAHPDLSGHIISLQKQLEGEFGSSETETVDPAAYLGTKSDTIKVDFKRLDDLLNLVGELVIFKTRLNQIETDIRETIENKALSKELNDGLELMGKTIAGLQEGIMRTRMLPVSQVFNKFPRMVRDLAKTQGKDIRLIFEGEDTELDKTVIDELDQPLLHIIRNAIDHGLETPDERAAGGKTLQGRIRLSAGQESSYVIIRVEDDGKGIDYDQVKEAAVTKGLIKPEDPLDRDAIFSLIFSPNFSTRNEVTDLSGRGIGLDIVNKNISKLNGQVSVESTPGKGTKFTIKLPLSLAIIPALMAETGDEVYAIPMNAVDESIKIREEDIHIINNHEVVHFREKVIPVVRLNDFFGLERRKVKNFYLVILGRAEKRLAIAVDRLKGQQEIVIKPLDETFGKSYGIAGASILGDGRIVLIADVMAFWNAREGKKIDVQ